MKKKRYSKQFEIDWAFYLSHKDKFTFCGQEVYKPKYDRKGKSAKECFYLFDSTGKREPCRQPTLYQEVLRCKKAINWQIKMWVEGYDDMLMGIQDYMKEFTNPPEWVETALRKQLLAS